MGLFDRKREVPDEVKQVRRAALDAGIEAHIARKRAGDEAGAAEELEALKAMDLLVTDEYGRLATGPDIADD